MQEFRDGNERRHSSPPAAQPDLEASADRLEEVGDLHFHAAAYTSAMDYYRSAARKLPDSGAADAAAARRRLRLLGKIGDCHRVQGQLRRARTELERAAQIASAVGPVDSAAAEVRLSRLLQAQGRYDEAIAMATQAFAVLSLTDRHGDVAVAQMVLGIAHACQSKLTKAEEFFQDALATYRRIGDPISQAHVLNNLALLAKRACRWPRALQLYERAEELFRRHGANAEMCAIHLNRAVLLRKMGRSVEAEASAVQGLKLARTRGDQGGILRFDLVLGQLKIDAQVWAEAEEYLMEARVLAEAEDSRRDLALADEFLGDLMFGRGEVEEALANFDRAEERARELSPTNDILAEVSRRRAQVYLHQGAYDRVLDEVAEGVRLVETSGEEFERGFLLRTRGDALAALGRVEESRRSHEAALATFQRLHLDVEVYRTLVSLGAVLMVSTDSDALVVARARFNEALAIELPSGSGVRRCEAQLALAEVEMRLRNFDDALIALFELERTECASSDGDSRVSDLRARIEAEMSVDARESTDSLQLLADLSDHVSYEATQETVASTLRRAAERLSVDRGFVASRNASGRISVLANHRLPLVTARVLARRGWELLGGHEAGIPRVFSRVAGDSEWSEGLPENRRPIGPVVAIRMYDPASGHEGLFYFDVAAPADGAVPFDADGLGVASTFADLLRDSVLETTLRSPTPSEFEDEVFAEFLTQSEPVREVLGLCSKVAPSPYTVLFNGETGTGKGLLAKIIHRLSPRADRAFVSVNCAAIPETLLESELFGHVRGAFTGAERDKAGLLVAADHGTLFLDEIGKMTLPMQAKLLHFLDSREVRPVGSSKSRAVDVRVLCASKRNLEQKVAAGEFLEDLYYRLLDFPIEIPPLRERGEDIVLLAQEFVDRASSDLGRPVPTLTRAFVAELRQYAWPGNVRELEKAMRRAVVLAAGDSRLRLAHLPRVARTLPLETGDESGHTTIRPLKEQVADLERSVIQRTLDELGWNRSEAARRLKISYPTLLQKIRIFGLKESC